VSIGLTELENDAQHVGEGTANYSRGNGLLYVAIPEHNDLQA